MQIAGADPAMLADCAQFNVERGAQIIDINMGCPAKKVCNSWCGSALLQDEDAGRSASSRRWCACGRRAGHAEDPHRLGSRRTRMRWRSRASPKQAGIAMLAMHGRTRADGYKGDAEYDTIAAVKAAVRIPVVANGDITTPEKAKLRARRTPAPTR